MSDGRRRLRFAIAALVLGASAAAGVYVAATLAPERLRGEVERQVARATGAPCRVDALLLSPGLPIEVESRGLALWDGALTIERARARVSIAAALVGEVRLSRLELEGAVLRVAPRAGSTPAPRRAGGSAELDAPGASGDVTEDLLASLHEGVGAALGALALADTLVVRGGRVDVALEARKPFSLEDIHVRLSHRRLRGDSTLAAQMRIRSGDAHHGLVEWNGSRDAAGVLGLAVAATELDLGWLAALGPRDAPRPGGFVSGVADFALSDPEHARVELDLVARDLGWHLAGERPPVLEIPRVSARGAVLIEPGRLSMTGARVRGGPIDAAIDAAVERPIAPGAKLDLSARIADLSIDDLLGLLRSAPAPWVDDAEGILAALDGGRVASFEARSRGPLSDWGGEAGADSRGLPPGLQLGAHLEDLRVQLGPDEAIEGVSVRATWVGDRVVLRDLVGRRGQEGMLPRVDLEFDGVSRLLAADLDQRVAESDDVMLAGLPLLISLFEPEPDAPGRSPAIELHLSHLDHPAVLWPVRALDIAFREGEDLLVGEIRGGTWAGVPLRGTLRWRGEPMYLDVALEAGEVAEAPASAPPAEPAGDGLPLDGVVWAAGRFEIGPLESEVWSHERLRGRVRAARSQVAFDAVETDALPSGRLEGEGILDLGQERTLPYRVVFHASDLDADALFAQAKLGRGLVAGRVDASGDLRGRYEPGRHPTAALTGEVELAARDGHVRHDLPAVLALTLAGEGLDFRSERDVVRYTSCESRLELRDGVAHTEALDFEGPDLRMFGSGSLDLGHPPHALDAEVVVFLFRPVDRVLGAMPIVGDLLLGGSENLFGAYFQLAGPWDAPLATYQPLRSLNTGPLRLVTGLPGVVLRGIESLGTAGAGPEPAPEGPPPGNGATP